MAACPSCGHENPEDAKFCGECGTALRVDVTCSRCGFTNAPGVKLCHGCGALLGEASPSLPAPTPQPSPDLTASFADGRYQVKRFIGEGGRKRVHLAPDTKLDRDVRIGPHTGEAIKEGADFFGRQVNLAARVAGQAQGGEILVSSLLTGLTKGAGEFTFAEGRAVGLKGLRVRLNVFEALC